MFRFHKKTLAMESGSGLWLYLKVGLHSRYFPKNFAKSFRKLFYRTPGKGCFWKSLWRTTMMIIITKNQKGGIFHIDEIRFGLNSITRILPYWFHLYIYIYKWKTSFLVHIYPQLLKPQFPIMPGLVSFLHSWSPNII